MTSRTHIISRLRRWAHAVDAPPASDLMDQAADEIERLLTVIDSYSHSAAAAAKEIRDLKDRLQVSCDP